MQVQKKCRYLLRMMVLGGLLSSYFAIPSIAEMVDTKKVVEKGLIGYWPMNEGSGHVIHDQTGMIGNGELFGVEWKPLNGGYVLQFGGRYPAGIDSGRAPVEGFRVRGGNVEGFTYGRLPIRNFLNTLKLVDRSNPAADRTAQMSISLWVKAVDGGLAQPEGEKKSVILCGGAFYVMITDGRWQGLCDNLNKRFIRGPEVQDDTWTHLVLGYDEAFAHFYVDGVEVGVEKGPYLISKVRWKSYEKAANYALFFLGAQSPNFKVMMPFKGEMGEIKLFNRMLTEDEVQSEYQAGKVRYQ